MVMYFFTKLVFQYQQTDLIIDSTDKFHWSSKQIKKSDTSRNDVDLYSLRKKSKKKCLDRTRIITVLPLKNVKLVLTSRAGRLHCYDILKDITVK